MLLRDIFRPNAARNVLLGEAVAAIAEYRAGGAKQRAEGSAAINKVLTRLVLKFGDDQVVGDVVPSLPLSLMHQDLNTALSAATALAGAARKAYVVFTNKNKPGDVPNIILRGAVKAWEKIAAKKIAQAAPQETEKFLRETVLSHTVDDSIRAVALNLLHPDSITHSDEELTPVPPVVSVSRSAEGAKQPPRP